MYNDKNEDNDSNYDDEEDSEDELNPDLMLESAIDVGTLFLEV